MNTEWSNNRRFIFIVDRKKTLFFLNLKEKKKLNSFENKYNLFIIVYFDLFFFQLVIFKDILGVKNIGNICLKIQRTLIKFWRKEFGRVPNFKQVNWKQQYI